MDTQSGQAVDDRPTRQPPARTDSLRAPWPIWVMMLACMGAVGALAYVQFSRAPRTGYGRGAGPSADALPVVGAAPEFTFTERDGRTVRTADLRGKVWIADFIFTRCAGPCPVMTERMRRLQDELDRLRWNDVKLVSFSVDPVRDTPEVLRTYADQYGAGAGRWLFLTGDKAAIFDVSINGFKLPLADENETDPIIHSTMFVVVDRRGRIRAYFDAVEDDPTLQQLADLPPTGTSAELDRKILRAVEALLMERGP